MGCECGEGRVWVRNSWEMEERHWTLRTFSGPLLLDSRIQSLYWVNGPVELSGQLSEGCIDCGNRDSWFPSTLLVNARHDY